MRRLSLRTRLAALLGIPLVILAAALLVTSYVIVTRSLEAPLPDSRASVTVDGAMEGVPRPTMDFNATQAALLERARTQLVGRYALVLTGTAVVALVLGWLLASRLVGSLHRVTEVARRVSSGALGERVGIDGPRDEMRELADAFDAMLVRLDATFDAQRRFIANAAHELRTPLTAMRAEVEVLCQDPAAAAADVAAATVVLRRQLANSEQLIDALLDLARSEPGLLRGEAIDLAALATEALADAGPAIAARGLRVDSRLDAAPCGGDRRLLARLASNLIANATSHNHPRGWISVATAVEQGDAVLTIANSGPLIPDQELEGLTQPFRRGGRARVGTGHGLGLAIVAAIARAHEARLRIDNPGTGGLRIEVRLPARAA